VLSAFAAVIVANPAILFSETKYSKVNNTISYSFFGETGETESVFTIAGRNFPIKVGSVGLKASLMPNENIEFYSRTGVGYSQKQGISAYNFNVSGSVFATSIGAGASANYRIRTQALL
jgi:hypothetical protein